MEKKPIKENFSKLLDVTREKSKTTTPKIQKVVTNSKKKMEVVKALSIQIPLKMFRDLKIRAAKEGRTIKSIIIQSIEKNDLNGA